MTLPLMPPRLGVGAPPAAAPPLAPPLMAPPGPLLAPPVGTAPPDALAPAPGGAPPGLDLAAMLGAVAPPAVAAPSIGPPPGPPPPDKPIPPTIQPGTKLKERPDAKDITNPFERQATLILDTAEDWAKRMAANISDHPTESVPTDPATIHEMFHFSKYGVDAPKVFWEKHAELLQMATNAGDPDPHAVAERGALDEVYPYRAKLGLLDSLGPNERVTRAEELLRTSHAEIARGNPHDALPTLVSPAGLPPATSQEGA